MLLFMFITKPYVCPLSNRKEFYICPQMPSISPVIFSCHLPLQSATFQIFKKIYIERESKKKENNAFESVVVFVSTD